MSLGRRVENAAGVEEAVSNHPATRDSKAVQRQHEELAFIINEIKSLLARIDQDIPLIQLAITGSGESMSSVMPHGISPSRLMQASTFLSIGDTQFANDATRPVQIGPSFSVSLYMLFLGHSSSKAPTGRQQNPGGLPTTPKAALNGHEKPAREESYGLGETDRKPIWQEVIHKARVRLCRTPLGWSFDPKLGYCASPVKKDLSTNLSNASRESPYTLFGRTDGYSYHLEIIEDLDDGRLHEEDKDSPKHELFEDIPWAGIRESLPIHQVSKIFYTNTGKMLNIGNVADGANNPALLLKRDPKAASPGHLRRGWGEESDLEEPPETKGSETVVDGEDHTQDDVDRQLLEEIEATDTPSKKDSESHEGKWQFPKHLDPEWFAFEVYTEDEDVDDDDEEDDEGEEHDGSDSEAASSQQLAVMKPRLARDRSSVDLNLLEQLRNISIRSPVPSSQQVPPRSDEVDRLPDSPESFVARSPFGCITSSLSLLEMLIRLTSLQEYQQTSHLAIPDYILTFFLEKTSTTGLHGEQRWKARSEARRKVGFDPYTDTPTK